MLFVDIKGKRLHFYVREFALDSEIQSGWEMIY